MRSGSNSNEAGSPSRFFGLSRNGTDLDIFSALMATVEVEVGRAHTTLRATSELAVKLPEVNGAELTKPYIVIGYGWTTWAKNEVRGKVRLDEARAVREIRFLSVRRLG